MTIQTQEAKSGAHVAVPCRNLTTRSSGHESAVTRRGISKSDFEDLTNFLSNPSTEETIQDHVRSILERMMKEDVFPSMPGQEAALMIMVADALEDPSFVVQVYQCLREAQVPPSPITLEMTANACASIADWKTALEVVEYMHQEVDNMHPTVDIYEDAIRACRYAKQWLKAKQLLEEMQTYDLEPSPEIFVTCIQACIESRELTATKKLARQLFERYGFEEEILHDAYSQLWESVEQIDDKEHGIALWHDRAHFHFELDSNNACQFLNFFAKHREWELVSEVYHATTGRPRRHGSLAFPSSNYTEGVEGLLQSMLDDDFEVQLPLFNAVMREYGRHEQMDKAVRLLDEMKTRVKPDVITYHAAMRACVRDLQYATKLYDEMRGHNISPTADVYHALLLSAMRAEEYKLVLSQFESFSDEDAASMSQDSRILSIIVIAHSKLENQEVVIRCFSDMKMNGLQPNLAAYAATLRAFIHLDQPHRALMLFDHLVHQQDGNEGVNKNRRLWEEVVEAAVKVADESRMVQVYHLFANNEIQITPRTAALLVENLHDVPVYDHWSLFRKRNYLHRRSGNTNESIATVTNAALKRAVEELDQNTAEQIVMDAYNNVDSKLTAGSFNWMIRLYTLIEDTTNLSRWFVAMKHAQIEPTTATFRSIFRHLSNAANPSDAAVLAICRYLDIDPSSTVTSIGFSVLQRMVSLGIPPDELSIDHYLRLPAGSDADAQKRLALFDEHLDHESRSPKLMEMLLHHYALQLHQDNVRQVLLKHLMKLDSAGIDCVVANFSSNQRVEACASLLEALVLEYPHQVTEDQVVLLLTSLLTDERSSDRSIANAAEQMASSMLGHGSLALSHGTVVCLMQIIVRLSEQCDLNHTISLFTALLGRLGLSQQQANAFVVETIGPEAAQELQRALRNHEQ